jgi:hypothetical protein
VSNLNTTAYPAIFTSSNSKQCNKCSSSSCSSSSSVFILGCLISVLRFGHHIFYIFCQMLDTAVGHALWHIDYNKILLSSRVVVVSFDVSVRYSAAWPFVAGPLNPIRTFVNLHPLLPLHHLFVCLFSRSANGDRAFPSSKFFSVNNRSLTLLLLLPSTIMSFTNESSNSPNSHFLDCALTCTKYSSNFWFSNLNYCAFQCESRCRRIPIKLAHPNFPCFRHVFLPHK